MKLEDIYALWSTDSNIDKTEIGSELLKLPKLHHKYFQILSAERIRLLQLTAEQKQLKLDKYEFYTQGHTPETKEKGWTLPSRGALLKAEAQPYIDCDKDVVDSTLKVGIQNEKVELLRSIIDEIKSRNWYLRGCIEWEKFRNGG
jgi:hypothetical protein